MGSGFKSKKKEIVDMGNYVATDKEQEAYLWGVRNGIRISPSAKNNKEWYLTIEINSKVSKSPIAYGKIEIWQQLYKFYMYYYNKHHKVKEIVKDIKKVEVEKQKEVINYKLF